MWAKTVALQGKAVQLPRSVGSRCVLIAGKLTQWRCWWWSIVGAHNARHSTYRCVTTQGQTHPVHPTPIPFSSFYSLSSHTQALPAGTVSASKEPCPVLDRMKLSHSSNRCSQSCHSPLCLSSSSLTSDPISPCLFL